MNWTQGKEYCIGFDGHLLTIHSEETQIIAENLCKTRAHKDENGTSISNGCWIGLFDNGTSTARDWHWVDGSDLDYGFNSTTGAATSGVYPWDGPEPNIMNENCVHLKTNWKWNDRWCDHVAYPICSGSETPYPSKEPTDIPTAHPTELTAIPTPIPSQDPSFEPTTVPTAYPTFTVNATKYCNFSIGSDDNAISLLPRFTYRGSIGYSSLNNTIFILGGTAFGKKRQALSFNVMDFDTADILYAIGGQNQRDVEILDVALFVASNESNTSQCSIRTVFRCDEFTYRSSSRRTPKSLTHLVDHESRAATLKLWERHGKITLTKLL